MRRFILPLIVFISLAWAGSLVAGPMVLTSDGQLYKVWSSPEEGLVLSHVVSGMENEESLIPQSLNVSLETVSVLVDEPTGTVFVLWEDADQSISRIRLAVQQQETWMGPTTLGGETGFLNSNPQMMLDHAVSEIPAEDPAGQDETLKTTFLHIVWWQHDENTGLGHGVYLPIALDSNGLPLIDESRTIDLQDLLPYGFGCADSPDVAGLAHPQFLRDSKGLPLLFTTDFSNCVFHILTIQYEVEETNNPDGSLEKRRRQIAVFRTSDLMMVIPPNVILTDAKMLLGSDFSVLIYWDGEDGINWIRSNSQGWSEMKSLSTGDLLNHEQAVELIRNLVY